MNHNQKQFIKNSLSEAKTNLENFLSNEKNIESIDASIETIIKTINDGGKVFTCGNGGSMCDAMHFAQEFTGRFDKERTSLPAIAISDPSYITCTANDYGYEAVFERVLTSLGKEGDVLLVLSTSGNSPNVLNAVKKAKEQRITSIGLLGKDGGKTAPLCDISIIAPGRNSARIQEIHIKCIHIIIEAVEKKLFFA
jgi:D-sedoheptulose 7-phosphate isomerase